MKDWDLIYTKDELPVQIYEHSYQQQRNKIWTCKLGFSAWIWFSSSEQMTSSSSDDIILVAREIRKYDDIRWLHKILTLLKRRTKEKKHVFFFSQNAMEDVYRKWY